jgi:hypothetical protein
VQTHAQWLRELAEPLLTHELYSRWVAAGRALDATERARLLVETAKDLPPRNLSTLRTIAYHLARVEARSASNKMTFENLGVVFGPNLLRGGSEESMASMATDSRAVVTAVSGIIEHREAVFASLPAEIECLTAVSVFPTPPGAMSQEMNDKEFGGSLVDYFARPATAPVRKYTAHRSLAATAAAAAAAAQYAPPPPRPAPASGAAAPVVAAAPAGAPPAAPAGPSATEVAAAPVDGGAQDAPPAAAQQDDAPPVLPPPPPPISAISHLSVSDDPNKKRLSSAIVFSSGARMSISQGENSRQYIDNDSDEEDGVPPPPEDNIDVRGFGVIFFFFFFFSFCDQLV